jgi:hypothetical protein
MAVSILRAPCDEKARAWTDHEEHDQSAFKPQSADALTDYDEGYLSSDWTEISDDDCASPRSPKEDSPFGPPMPPPGLSLIRNDLVVHEILPCAEESNDSDEEDLSEAAKLAIRKVSTRARITILHEDVHRSMVEYSEDSDDDEEDLSESAKAALRRFAKFG